jgi:SprT protein
MIVLMFNQNKMSTDMTAPSNDLRQRAIERVHHFMAEAERICGRKFDPVTVHFDIGGYRVAGNALYSKRRIGIHPGFLAKFPEETLSNTVPHEVAHMITHDLYRYPVKDHGPEWASVMVRFGVPAERCHNHGRLEGWTPRVKAKYTIQCSACKKVYEVTSRVYNSLNGRRCRCGNHTLITIATPIEEVARVVAQSTTSYDQPAPVQPGNGKYAFTPNMAKLAKCTVIYMCHAGVWSRAQLINEFISVAGCTPAGAATYYATLKKNHG